MCGFKAGGLPSHAQLQRHEASSANATQKRRRSSCSAVGCGRSDHRSISTHARILAHGLTTLTTAHGRLHLPCRPRARYDAPATPPDAANHRQAAQRHGSCYDPIYAAPPLEEPPPSYDAATHASTSPLLVGPPPDYGAFQAYADPDESSEASSDADDTEQYLPEQVGQAVAVTILVGLLYLFWRIISQPGPDGSLHPYA
ncbi:hypothetical protein OPT61_g8550 [Boeremia exigua]|uniref:Uncharacterized protein n=1 Tax=Boeremia exigua TaxID=749465 RepID=A0ACC2HYW2_9PLEO|nr:hypothetical protein OPT61_g8550 [Boeremia exigua]